MSTYGLSLYGASVYEASMNPNTTTVTTWDTDSNGTWTVYKGWNGLAIAVMAQTGGSALVLNSDTLGLLNQGILGPTADGWTDLGCDLMNLDLLRGASVDGGVLLRAEAGTCRLVLDNVDLTYEPFVTDAFPLGLGTTIAVLGIESAAVDFLVADPSLNPWSEMFGLFYGKIDSVTCSGYETEQPVAEIVAVDDTQQLQNYNGLEQTPVGAGDTTEERINRTLENAEWSVFIPAFGSDVSICDFVDSGVFNPTHQTTTLAQPAWEEILRTGDAANRLVYFKGNGQLAAEPISPISLDEWHQYTWGCVEDVDVLVAGINVAFDKTQLVNIVDAARTGGQQVTVTDSTSVNRHGAFRWGRNDLTLENDVDVETFAGFIVNASSEPAARVTSMRVVPSVWPADDMEVTDGLYDDTGLLSESQRNAWNLLLDFTSRVAPALWRQVITAPIPGSTETITDTVALRGVRFTLDADTVELDFVTSSIRQFLDLFILDDDVRGILDSGYRVA